MSQVLFSFIYTGTSLMSSLYISEQNKACFPFLESLTEWGEILGIPDVKSLNKIVRDGSINDIILASEALRI